VLADLFGIRQRTAFADGCGRVGDIDPITVPELAALAQRKLAALCNAPDTGTAVQVKFADTGKPVRRLAVISGAGGSLFAEAIAEGADCLLTGEANHHHALDAKRLGLSLIAAGHYATEFPVTAAVAAALRTAGGAGEHREPRPVYLFIKREPSPSLLRNATSPERGRSFSINRKRAKALPQALTERVIDKTR
jgi:putative NIF3 family GTP cyclohydrolase 1 type 2